MSQHKETMCAGVDITFMAQRRFDAVSAVGSGFSSNKRQRTGTNGGQEHVHAGGRGAKSTSAAGKRGNTAPSSTRHRPNAAIAARTPAADMQSRHALSHRRPESCTREGMRSSGVPSLSATGRPMRRSRQLSLPCTEDSPVSRTSKSQTSVSRTYGPRAKENAADEGVRREEGLRQEDATGGAGGCEVVKRRKPKRKRLFSKPVSWRVLKGPLPTPTALFSKSLSLTPTARPVQDV